MGQLTGTLRDRWIAKADAEKAKFDAQREEEAARPKRDPIPPPPVDERPRCPQCDKPMRPRIEREEIRIQDEHGHTYKLGPPIWQGDFIGYGAFCSLRCCERFANAAFRAGHRIKR